MHVLAIKPEMVLYFFMANCIAVLIFNIMYIFIDKYEGKRGKRRSIQLEKRITQQLMRVAGGQTVEPAHIKYLTKSLRRLRKLHAFEESFAVVQTSSPVAAESMADYIRQIRPVFMGLTSTYAKRDTIEQAYFAWLIESLGIDEGRRSFDEIIQFLLLMISKKDVFVRENALKALYAIGFPDAVLSAWSIMENNEIYHSAKLLTDGLLSFRGDKQALARLLYSRRLEFSDRLVLPVMQFIRYFSGDYQEQFLALLDRDNEGKELRLEAIRYLGRYPYEKARPLLQRMIQYEEYIDWEYAAMSARTLANYPGPDTERALKGGLHARSWYVRLNCAEALVDGLQLPLLQLYEIYNGRDRYAREILQYVFEKSEIRNQKLALEAADV